MNQIFHVIGDKGRTATQIDTIIVGGGQAGLPVSYYLTQARVTHLILERASKVAEAWRTRWDSFTLNTPNWQSHLPGAECPGKHPDRFLSRKEIIAYFERYVEHFHLPFRYNVAVESFELNRSRDGFVVETNAGRFAAKNVVVATGLYQQPKVPEFSGKLPAGLMQLHSDAYRTRRCCLQVRFWL